MTFLFSPLTTAQNSEELRFLVFDPVLIQIQQDGEEQTVTELTHLPRADDTLDVSGYLASQFRPPEVNPTDDGDMEVTIASYEERIKDLELQGGAYEPSLSQELFSLGNLYQSYGEHEKALEYFDKALHINRVNLGLYNLDQEKIIEKKIESDIAIGDLFSADMQQEYLFYLKRKAYGNTSVELLPALTRYAEWNIFAFDSRINMKPTLTYASEADVYTENSVNNSIGEEDFRTHRLMNAQNIYSTIIQILLNNYGITDPRLPDMEKKLALTNYFFATNFDINSSAYSGNNSALTMSSSQGFYDVTRVSSNSMGYRHGREALERRLDYVLNKADATPMDIARAKLELGDWLLIFKKRNTALELYQEAYEELVAREIPQADIDSLFSPDLPQAIPTFLDYPYSRAALEIPDDVPLDYQGWIDTRIRINRYGQPVDVDILDRSLSTTDPIESRLLRHLRNSITYRPRFENGALLGQDLVEARYYYSY